MTEVEWLRCLEPQKMADFLNDRNWGSARKFRLFVCACVRRIWHLLSDDRYRVAVELSEQAADGLITDEYISDVWLDWIDQGNDFGSGGDAMVAALAATGVSFRWDWEDAHQYAVCAATGVDIYDLDPDNAAVAIELEAQTRLLRCIMGNPFHHPPSIPADLMSWNDGTLIKIAQGIYDARSFDNLPILADALEEAGCDNADILGHFRGPRPHVRGCWGLDLILGKS
jgi:hypothetical protein